MKSLVAHVEQSGYYCEVGAAPPTGRFDKGKGIGPVSRRALRQWPPEMLKKGPLERIGGRSFGREHADAIVSLLHGNVKVRMVCGGRSPEATLRPPLARVAPAKAGMLPHVVAGWGEWLTTASALNASECRQYHRLESMRCMPSQPKHGNRRCPDHFAGILHCIH